MKQLIEWLKANPEVVAALIGLAGSLLTAVFKPRSPEQYAAMPPRLAGFLKFGSALFPDIVKAWRALRQIRTADAGVEIRAPKPDPESPPQLSVVKSPENDPEDGSR